MTIVRNLTTAAVQRQLQLLRSTQVHTKISPTKISFTIESIEKYMSRHASRQCEVVISTVIDVGGIDTNSISAQ